MSDYDEFTMRKMIDDCLDAVAVVLDNNKHAAIAAADTVPHQYEDKYLLANDLTNMSIACILNALELMGVSHAQLCSFKSWNAHRAVSLKFERRLKCEFVKEIEREVEDPTRVQLDIGIFRSMVKTITKVKEYVYLIEAEYTLSAHSGVGDRPAEVIQITSSSSQLETTLRTNTAPFYNPTVNTFDVNISWLLKHLDEAASTATFSIDRAHASCATPRQNADVEATLLFHNAFSLFSRNVFVKLQDLSCVQSRYGVATAAKFYVDSINTDDVFNPVVPLFHNDSAKETVVSDEETVANRSVALPQPVVNQLVQEQRRSLVAKCTKVAGRFVVSTTEGAVFTTTEATLMVPFHYLSQSAYFYE